MGKMGTAAACVNCTSSSRKMILIAAKMIFVIDLWLDKANNNNNNNNTIIYKAP